MPDLSSLEDVVKFSYSGFQQIVQNPPLLMLIFVGLIVFYFHYSKQREIWENSIVMIIIFMATFFLHMQFARTGWFFRYEAYLIALGIFIISISLSEYLPEKFQIRIDINQILRYVALAFIFLPFVLRGTISLIRIPRATTNIYEQQYQMGLFYREFYQMETVAANDIGAINYLADIKCFDLWGLGNLEVGRAIRGRHYNSQQIYGLTKAKHVRIAIVYDHWFARDEIGGIPSQWIKVGEWKILNNVVCHGNTVSFYAVDPFEVNNLIQNLRDFSSHLPKDVVQTGAYTKYRVDGGKRVE